MTPQQQYGLRFKSYEVEKEKRTGLNLTPKAPMELPAKCTLSFYLKFNLGGQHQFGYIFRLISSSGYHIDFLQNSNNLRLTTENKLINIPLHEVGLDYNQWFKVNIDIDREKEQITVSIGKKSVLCKTYEVKEFRSVSIIFGKSDYPRFQYTDIPPMSVRDIEIADDSRKELFYWELKRHTIGGAYDKTGKNFAVTENPVWIIDENCFWKKIESFKTCSHPQFDYNEDKDELFLYDEHKFYIFTFLSNKLTETAIDNPQYYQVRSNSVKYNPLSKQYLWYTFLFDDPKDVLTYDTIKKGWDTYPTIKESPTNWHHNRFISAVDSNMYLFGGYGHYTYKNHLYCYNLSSKKWRIIKLKGDKISPRYLSALGKYGDNKILIFGGYGSETGSQELSPHFYYDLYEVDLTTMKSKKLWELSMPQEDFVLANSIVVDKENKVFYGLAFSTQKFHTELSLLKFSIDKPQYEVLNNTLKANFDDTRSYFDLFLNKKKDRLIAVTSFPENLNVSTNTVIVNTLRYPPLMQDDAVQIIRTRIFLLPVIIFLAVTLAVVVFILIIRIVRKRSSGLSEDEVEEIQYFRKPPINSSFYFLGDFRIINKEGNELTDEFSPTLKLLFILISLYTFKGGKGISTSKLNEIFWFEKSEEQAKNNRGVFMNKLRRILSQLGEVNIVSARSFWKVEFGDGIYCDYYEALLLIEKLKEEKEGAINIADLLSFLSIISSGSFLPNIQTEWSDPFKADFSNTVVDLLIDLSQHKDIKNSSQLCLDIADAIFVHDSLSEEALNLKIITLIKMKRHGLAKNIYMAFSKEYENLLNEPFKPSFEQIIKSEQK